MLPLILSLAFTASFIAVLIRADQAAEQLAENA